MDVDIARCCRAAVVVMRSCRASPRGQNRVTPSPVANSGASDFAHPTAWLLIRGHREKESSEETMPHRVWLVAAIASGLMLPQPALAQMKVRVGQPQAGTFQFVPLQAASEAGIFKRHGVDIEVISFAGGPRVQQ